MKLHHQLLILFISILCLLGYSQTQERRYNGDENRLRMCIQWNDSTDYQTTDDSTLPSRPIYKFKVRSLFWGIYAEREIYIVTHWQSLNQFNPLRDLKHDYFWTLRKSDNSINGYPVYIHSGNF